MNAAVPPILEVHGLVKEFPVGRGLIFNKPTGHVRAVTGVSFKLAPGETLGLRGRIRLRQVDLGPLRHAAPDADGGRGACRRQGHRERHPARTARAAQGSADRLPGSARLAASAHDPAPHPRGRNADRRAFARARALRPKVIVLDEPVSALDVSVQAGVLNLLQSLQRQLGVAYLFIAHDLAVVRHISHRVAVMYLGGIVETATVKDLYDRPRHPYTQALLSAAPHPDPKIEKTRSRIVLQGDVPSPLDPPSGCRFRTRCWKATEVCARLEPAIRRMSDGHFVACHHPPGDA